MEEKNDNQRIWNEKWDKLALYATYSAGNRWAEFLIRKIISSIKIEKGLIVDMGCGVGNKSAVLAKAFPDCRVIGYDFSSEGIAFARQHYSGFDNLSFECADARDALRGG